MISRYNFLTMLFLSVWLSSIAITGLFVPKALAIDQKQKNLYKQHVLYYDIDSCASGSANSSSVTSGNANQSGGGPVYILGDSILKEVYFDYGAVLKKKLDKAGLESSADASGGRALTYAGSAPAGNLPGVNKPGLDAIEPDLKQLESKGNKPNTVVIALGTNADASTAVFKDSMQKAIETVKKVNGSAAIYWVNLFSTSHAGAYNNAIEDVAKQKNINVIDMTKTNIPTDDNVHPNINGIEPYSETIVKALTKKNSSSGGGSASGGAASQPVEIKIDGPFKSGKPMPGDNINNGDAWKGTASTYGNDPKSGYVDPSDNNNPALPGASNKNPGIAVYNQGSLGGWWKVIAPNGKGAVLQQTDYGPSASPMVDINAVAARSVFGYKVGDAFPTGQGTWKIEYMGKQKPEGAITKDSGGSGDAIPDDSSSTTTSSGVCCSEGGGSVSELEGENDAIKAYNFFITNLDLTPAQASGIVGNLMTETGGGGYDFHPESVGEGMCWAGSDCRGIAQWDGTRWANLVSWAGKEGLEPETLEAQLGFIKFELEGDYSGALQALKGISGNSEGAAMQAAQSFNDNYEKGIDSTRQANAAKFFNEHASKGQAPTGGSTSESGGCAGGESIDGLADISDINIEKSDCTYGSAPGGCYRLPESKYWNQYSDSQTGSKCMVQLIAATSKAWTQKYPEDKPQIGDINAPGHFSHALGEDVDIYTPSAANMTTPGYSREKSIEYAKLWMSTGNIEYIFFNDRSTYGPVNQYAQQNGVPGVIQWETGHEDHFHVRIIDPKSNGECSGKPVG